jgi:hypothetical protein
MIVRIMGEGQVEISADDITVLNELDSELEAAIEGGDEKAFRVKLHALLDKVRHVGKSLPDDSLEPSELILPPADASIRGRPATAGVRRRLDRPDGPGRTAPTALVLACPKPWVAIADCNVPDAFATGFPAVPVRRSPKVI